MSLIRRRVLGMVLALTGTCGLLWPAASAGASESLRLALGYPDRWPVSEAVREGAKEYVQATEGSSYIEIFPEGTLGYGPELMAQLRAGTIDLVVVPASSLAFAASELEVLNLPFVFRDRQHFERFVDSDVWRLVAQRLEAVDLRLMAAGWIGDRRILTRDEVRSVADLHGLKLRSGRASSIEDAAFEALGIMPVRLNFSEIYQALSIGVVDANEGLASTMVESKLFYKQAKLIQSRGWGGYTAWLVAGSEVVNRLDQRDLELFEQTMREAMRQAGDRADSREAEATASLEDGGVDIITLDANEEQELRAKALEAMKQAAPMQARELIEAVLSTE